MKEDTLSQEPKNPNLLSMYAWLNLLEKQFTPTDNSLYMSYNKLTKSQQNLIKELLNNIPTGIFGSSSEVQNIAEVEQQIIDGQNKLGAEISEQGKIYQSIVNLKVGISKFDLSQRLKSMSKDIQDSRNNQLTKSFKQPFIIATIVLACSIPLSIFTDKRNSFKKTNTVNYEQAGG